MSWSRMLNFVKELKQEYLREHGSISYDYDSEIYKSVVEKWASEVENTYYSERIHFMYINQLPNSNIYLFKYRGYTEIYSNFEPAEFWMIDDGFYRYCRSITIDVEEETVVMAAYDKFFNINELPEVSEEEIAKKMASAQIIEITDKMDGSLQCARWYNNRLILSGSSALDRELSFRVDHGYRWLYENPSYIKMMQTFSNLSFIFEYIMDDDPHVVMYDYDLMRGLYLTGARRMSDGTFLNYSELKKIADIFGVWITKQETMTFQEIMDSRDVFLCGEKEGWVVNIDGLRVKVKCDDFTNLHGLLSGYRKTGPRLGNAIVKAWVTDSIDDLLSRMPGDYRKEAEKVLERMLEYLRDLDAYVAATCERMKQECGNPDDVKTFMLYAQKNCPKDILGFVCNTYRGITNNYTKGFAWSDVVNRSRLPQ